MSSYTTLLPQTSRTASSESCTDLPVCLTDSGEGKNSAKKHTQQPTHTFKLKLMIATYNARTLRLQEHMERLELEL